MTTLTERAVYDLEFLVWEHEANMSRESRPLAAGAALPAGQVLGKVTASGSYAPYNNAATDGTQTAVGILGYAQAARTGVKNVVVFERLCAVSESKLTGLDAAAKVDLATQQIVFRTAL